MSTSELPSNIILAGFMGSGKTTVGKVLAERLGWTFCDTDEIIEQRTKTKISEIFSQQGEPAFRDMESALAREMVEWHQRVVSTGGGFMLRPENLAASERAGFPVLLVASPDEIWHRVGRSRHRPLLQVENPRARIEQMLQERQSAYEAIAHKISTDGLTPDQVAQAILDLIHSK